MKCSQSNVTLLFFPDFSPATAIRRKAFGPVLKKMLCFPVAQMVEHGASNTKIMGSIPRESKS